MSPRRRSVPDPLPDPDRPSWVLRLPFSRPLSLNEIVGKNRHAVQRKTKPWKTAAWALAKQQRIPSLERFTVVLHHAPRVPGEGVRDVGNYEGTLKPCVDGLVLARVCIDDNLARYVPSDPVVYPATGEPGRLWLVVIDLSDRPVP